MAQVRTQIPVFSALDWLREGLADMRATRFVGVYYGAVFAAIGYIIAFVYGAFWQATMGLMAGFFLMGPIICTGIYDLSRQLKNGEPVSLVKSWTSWMVNWKSIGFFSIILTFLMIVWARVSVVIFALFASHDYPNLKSMVAQIVSMRNFEFIVVWLGVGSVFATLAFAISVVSVPMLLDRKSDTLDAIFTSARALWNNLGAALVWAATIVGLIGFSLLVFKPLLIVTAPLVGHATWKAYQALVVPQGEETIEPSKPLWNENGAY